MQGGAGACGSQIFPGIYARLDDYDVLNFIYKTAFGKTVSARSLLLGKKLLKINISVDFKYTQVSI